MSTNHFYVAIIAPFGSGKTTLMETLVDRFKSFFPVYALGNTDHITIKEAMELYPNNFKDKLDFIQSRILDNDALTIQKAFREFQDNRPGIIIADSSYHEHYCYIMTKYRDGKLKSHQHKRLMFKFYAIRNSLPNPDMFIYIDIPVSDILLNIKKRGRDYEIIDNDKELRKYITALKQKYQNLFFSRRNYRYDHYLLQHIFTCKPGSQHLKQNLKIEDYIRSQATAKLDKILNEKSDYLTPPIPSILDKEYKAQFFGGHRC